MKTCIISAIFGGSDTIREPVPQSCDCTFIMFTDNPLLKSTRWLINSNNCFPGRPPLYTAKYFKLQAWRRVPLLQQFDRIIWVDGSIQIMHHGFTKTFFDNPMTFIKHPWRDCIYSEANRGKDLIKYDHKTTDAQIQSYRNVKYPEHNGLLCGTVFGFHRTRATNKVMNDWWKQCTEFTMQDQISLPYALWKNQYSPTVLDFDLNNNEYFKKEAHCQKYYKKIRGVK